MQKNRKQNPKTSMCLSHCYIWSLIVRAVCLSKLAEVGFYVPQDTQAGIDCSNKHECDVHGNEPRNTCVHLLPKQLFYDSFICLVPTSNLNILILSPSDNTSLLIYCFKSLKDRLMNKEQSVCNYNIGKFTKGLLDKTSCDVRFSSMILVTHTVTTEILGQFSSQYEPILKSLPLEVCV